MKTFITNDEFNQILELLGLPGETLSIEIGMRDRWPFPGVNSSWGMRAVIGSPAPGYGPHGDMFHPYTETVVYVPVLLPGDVPPAQAWPDTVEEALETPPQGCASVPCPPFEEVKFDVATCPTCGRAELKWHFTQKFPCDDEFHNSGIANPDRLGGDRE